MTGVKWCLMWKGVEAAVNLLAFLPGTTMASHPGKHASAPEGVCVASTLLVR